MRRLKGRCHHFFFLPNRSQPYQASTKTLEVILMFETLACVARVSKKARNGTETASECKKQGAGRGRRCELFNLDGCTLATDHVPVLRNSFKNYIEKVLPVQYVCLNHGDR